MHFGSRLINQREQHLEGDILFGKQAMSGIIHRIRKVTGKDRRHMKPCPTLRVGTIHLVGQAVSQCLDLPHRLLIRSFDEERHLAHIDRTLLTERLQGI